MRTHARRFVLAAALMTAVCLLTRPGSAGDKGDVWKPFLPGDAYQELVKRAAKAIEEALEGTPSEEAVKRAQFNALMIAAYTMNAKEPGEGAALRAAALKIAKLAAQKGKAAEARKMAASVAALKGEAGAKGDFGKPQDYVEERHDVMEHFKTKMKGGEGLHPLLQSNIRLKGTQNGIEEKIRNLAMKKIADAALAKEADELALMAYRAAVVGALAHSYLPKPKAKGGTIAEWRELSLAMRDAAIALAEAAKKKDAEAVFKASTSLNSSCNQCHSAFRSN
ncbi:MAG: hypothetical protein L0Z62_14230 [Gemmataceae bacterium]|nr:hypothetical protein [Gemmataceae bacterium]